MSVDTLLGLPSNMVGYAFLLALLARVTGYTPRTVTGHLNQVHIYESHLKAAELLRSRLLDSPVSRLVFNETTAPRPDPVFLEPCDWFLKTCDHSHYEIQNYHPQEAIPGLVMAV